MPVNPNDPRPTYVQIADDLRQQIIAGVLSPGQRLPSGRQLAERYGVAPMTIQQAIGELDDVVVRWQGRGVFVREEAITPGDKGSIDRVISDLASLRKRMEALEERVEVLEAERVPPP